MSSVTLERYDDDIHDITDNIHAFFEAPRRGPAYPYLYSLYQKFEGNVMVFTVHDIRQLEQNNPLIQQSDVYPSELKQSLNQLLSILQRKSSLRGGKKHSKRTRSKRSTKRKRSRSRKSRH